MTLKKVLSIMPYCSKCGSEISEDAQFCPTCGAPVKIETDRTLPTPTQQKPVSADLFNRMIRAAMLDVTLYEEVEADETATTQAILVVVLSSFCSGIGTAMSQALSGRGPGVIGLGLIEGLFLALLAWLIWSFITYFIGTKVFTGVASFNELLRTIGFSNSPGVLSILSFIPILGGLISFAVWIWGLAAMVIAVRQALDFTTRRAILTCVIGWIVALIFLVIVGIVFALPFMIWSSNIGF
jgi:hypothetical protein